MHNHAPKVYTCPFCALIESDRNAPTLCTASDMIYRDERVAAFISSHQWPNNPGNTVVIPVMHSENLYDLPVDLAYPIHALVKSIAIAMKEAWVCEGISTRQHNEPAGSQDVWHYHVHVTPRYQGDAFYSTYAQKKTLMSPEERARLASDLRAELEFVTY